MIRFLIVLVLYYSVNASSKRGILPEIGMNATQLIEYRGYPSEVHEAVTEDGYILQLHRIPHGINNEKHSNKPVVLLIPGLFCNDLVYLINQRDKGLPYILADRDYDVWLGNTRGTTYSRKHIELDPDKDETKFFSYSMHERGYYDLPAMIDYILNKTRQDSLYYVGHSEGTTLFCIMAASRPEYNDKINLSVLLAPVVFMNHISSASTQMFSRTTRLLKATFAATGTHELLPSSDLQTALNSAICMKESPIQAVCKSAILLFCGWDSVQLNETQLPLITSIAPGGASDKEMFHLLQLVKTGKFQMYDFGLIQNLMRYHSISPPDYNLRSITAPVVLYYASNDRLSAIKDVERLQNELPNVMSSQLIEFEKWNHLDFLWAKEVNEYLYNDLVKIISIH